MSLRNFVNGRRLVTEFLEEWKQIIGFPSYLVSNYGRVKSLSRDYKYGSHEDIILSPTNRRGYLGVTLFRDGKRYHKAVHRLVAEAFIPNPNNLPCVNHKDENRTNNSADNLEWCTHEYNSHYGACREKISKGVSRKVAQYAKTGELIKIWDSMTSASEYVGITISSISYCCKHYPKFSAGGFKWRKLANE